MVDGLFARDSGWFFRRYKAFNFLFARRQFLTQFSKSVVLRNEHFPLEFPERRFR